MRRRLASLAALPVLAVAAAMLGTPTTPPATAPSAASDAAPGTAPGAAGTAPAVVRIPVASELGLAEPPDAFTAQRAMTADGTVPVDAYLRALAQADSLDRRYAGTASTSSRWQLAGPTNIGGRVLDVVVHPKRTTTIFIATATGGVWVSHNRGATFAPAWPASLTQSIGALAISKSGVLWAGTGEAGPGGGSITFGGTGIYKSADMGRTWKYVGLRTSSRVGRIVVDPKNENRVFVAATGNLYANGGERGLYLTTDGGRKWSRVLAGETPSTGAVDVAVDPVDSKRVFAAMWDNRREPDRRLYNGPGSGLFRSTDGGKTWARTGLPFLASSPSLGRIGVAIAPSDRNRVYAIATTESGLFAGFYASVDGGTTFTPRASVELVDGSYVYGWWFGRIYVDPTKPERVFSTGVGLAETTNGGLTWSGTGSDMHADHHGMAWDPKDPDIVYDGNDGGLYRSDDAGDSWDKGDIQPWSQLYSIDVAADDARRISAGLQDNGVVRSWDTDGEVSPHNWNGWIGGDGEATVINPENSEIVYGCYQYGECFVSKDGGNRTENFGLEVVAARKNWFTPVVLDPVDPSVVYTGGESLWRSTDDGSTWTRIGGATVDFSNGPGRETNPLYRNFGTITTIDATDQDTGVIMVGTDDGNVWVSRDSGESFTKAAGALPKRWVSRVAIDRQDPASLYATFSGYRQGDQAAHVYRSTNSGRTWTSIGKGLPVAPVNDILVIGRDLVVGTDVGVYVSRNGAKSWQPLGKDLPRAPVTDLSWHARTKRVYAATFGRSAYWVSFAPTTAKGGSRNDVVTVRPGRRAVADAAGAVVPGAAVGAAQSSGSQSSASQSSASQPAAESVPTTKASRSLPASAAAPLAVAAAFALAAGFGVRRRAS